MIYLQSVLNFEVSPHYPTHLGSAKDEGEMACSGFSLACQWISLSANEENPSWEYRFGNRVSHSLDGTEEYLFENFYQSVKTVLLLAVIQRFLSLVH